MHPRLRGLNVAVALGALVTAAAFAAGPGSSAPTAQSCPKPPALPTAWANQVDNPYLPLTAGTTWTYKGKLDATSATDVLTVTNQTKTQEDAKNVAEDCTKIADLQASIKTPYVTTSDALKTEELSLLEPDVLDNKYYVRGIGLVAERTVQGGTDFLDLVTVKGA
jgi:hypothetical protein